MATKVRVQANEGAVSALMAVFASMPAVNEQAQAVEKAKTGNYNAVVAAGAMCSSREEWEATNTLIQHNITHNVDGAAGLVKAELRKEGPTKDGAAFLMPRAITNALSVLNFAFQHSIPLVAKDKDKDGKEIGEPKVVSFGSLRKARTLKNDEIKQAAQEAAVKHLKGAPLYVHEIGVMVQTITKEAGSNVSETTLKSVHGALAKVVQALIQAKAKGEKPQAEPRKPAKAAKPKAKSGDVAADLSKAA